MIENAEVLTKRSEIQASWWRGYDDGYHAAPGPLPEFMSKPYTRFTAYERGYAFGRELKAHEGDMP